MNNPGVAVTAFSTRNVSRSDALNALRHGGKVTGWFCSYPSENITRCTKGNQAFRLTFTGKPPSPEPVSELAKTPTCTTGIVVSGTTCVRLMSRRPT